MSVNSFLEEFSRIFNASALGNNSGNVLDGVIVKPEKAEQPEDIQPNFVRLDVYDDGSAIENSNAPNILIELAQKHDVSLLLECVSDAEETSFEMKQHFMAHGFNNAGTKNSLMDDDTHPSYGEHIVFHCVSYDFKPALH